MSMDHNYARGKLKLLLRDLSSYNAGEFWREMSRIASGATASIHAEGLKAERDALAAHVEELTYKGDWLASCCNSSTCDDFGVQLDHWEAAKKTPPTTSLARRDALKQAEGMEGAALHIRQKALDYDSEHGATDPSTGTREYPGDGAEYFNEMMELADEIHQQADEIRQQAEGHQ